MTRRDAGIDRRRVDDARQAPATAGRRAYGRRVSELTTPTGRESALRATPRSDGTAPRAVVFGATGYLGGRLVPRLRAAGYRVRVLARSPERARAFAWGDDVEIVAGDATDAATVAQAVADVDVLYYLVHSMSAGAGFEDSDRVAAQTVADAAAAAGVRRIVYLGGLHPDDAPLSRTCARAWRWAASSSTAACRRWCCRRGS